jgi:hypothetical protein
MTKPPLAPFALQSDFDLLHIPVTDDVETIEAAFKKLRPSKLHQRNHGSHDERLEAEKWFDSCSRLLKPERSGELARSIFEQASHRLRSSLHGAEGKPLSSAHYESLLATLTGEYRFEPGLADRLLRQFLRDLGLKTGETIRIHIDRSRPVEDLTATPRADGVELSWKLPPSDCDGVVVVRTQKGPPESCRDGTELARARIERLVDTSARPGQKYTYAVYSVLGGTPAEQCRWCEGYRAAAGVEDFRASYAHPDAVLNWTPPKGCRRVWIFRAPRPAEVAIVGDRPAAPPEGQLVAQVESGATCTDRQVAPGAELHYLAVAEHAGGFFSVAAHTTLRTPAPLLAPRARPATSAAGRVVVEWERSSDAPHAFRLYRGDGPALKGLDDLTPVYQGPDTRYDDLGVETGKTYWYYVVAHHDGLRSAPTRLGPVVVINEVQGLQAVPGHRSIELRWRMPPNAVRLVVRRRAIGAAPHAGELELSGAGPTGMVDREVIAGSVYSYRVACVFHGADGRDAVSAGVTTAPCRPYELPAPPSGIHAELSGEVVTISWNPAPGPEVVVYRRATDDGLGPESPVPLSDLERGGRRLTPVAKGQVRDHLDPGQPWYLVAHVVNDATAVVRHRVVLAKAELRSPSHTPRRVELRWKWPAHLQRVLLRRAILDEAGEEDRDGRALWSFDRPPDRDESDHIDQVDDPGRPHVREYRLQPLDQPGSGIQTLVFGKAAVRVPYGPSRRILYRVQKRRRLMRRPENVLVLRLPQRLAQFPGLRVVAQRPGGRGEEGEVLATWPDPPRSVGPGLYEVALPRAGSPSRVILTLNGDEAEYPVTFIESGDVHLS